MDAMEVINYRGYEITAHYDEDTDSPDRWGDENAFIVYDHRQFFVERKGFNPEEIWEHVQETKQKTYDGYYVFPLYAYIHSGVSLSLGRLSYPFTCPWDTSMTGFVLVKREKGTWNIDKAEKTAESVVDEWNMFLSGEVYGYTSECGSCWGFYGEDGYKQMIEAAKSEIDYEIDKLKHKHFNQLKTWIKNRVPIEHRQQLLIA